MKFDIGEGRVLDVPDESVRKLIEEMKRQGEHDLAAVLEEHLVTEKPS